MQNDRPYWCLFVAVVFHSFGVMNPVAAQVKTEHFESDVSTIIKPWTHLNFNNDPKNFQFGIISDRAGGVRPGVFLEGINKLNLLMPEFVMSVGDFISGNTSDREQLLKEWAEFDEERKPLKMPFFYVPGNHDINNDVMRQVWKERFGVPFYSFVYKDVLFLALDTTGEKGHIVPDYQVDYVKKALEKHSDARWTFVFMHHPLWLYDEPGGFAEIEKALKGRKHTVIAGHTHHYLHERRGDTNYYILGTTGGGSQLRGSRYGEFDHVTLISMADEGPVMANLRLDGILPHDVTTRDDYELTRSLFNATRMPYTMLTDGEEKVTSGTLYLNFKNPSNNELVVKADFMHGHEVSMKPSHLDFTLAPGTSKPVEIEIESTEAIATSNPALLQLAWTMGYELEEQEDLFLSGTRDIAFKPSEMQIIRTVAPEFVDSIDVEFVEADKKYTARYTLDESAPTSASKQFTSPITISKATTISARLMNEKGQGTMTERQSYKPVPSGTGLRYRYYEGTWTRLPEFGDLSPLLESVATNLDVESRQLRADNWGMVLEGNLEIEKSGDYTFHLNSDDGSNLYIDDRLVIDNDGDHSVLELSGKANLSAGKHRLRLEFFDSLGEAILELDMAGPGMERQPLPFEKISH